MIRSKFFFKNYHFRHFNLTHKLEEVWPDGTTHIHSQVVPAHHIFRFVAPSFFSRKSTIFGGFFYMEEVVARYTHEIPLVTLILIYIWVSRSNFNRSSENRRHTDKWTNRQTGYSHFIV